MTKIGIIGCGNISDIYFKAQRRFPNIEIVACSDLEMDKALMKEAQYRAKACSAKDLLADPSIEIVVNLTIPAAHAEVDLAIIQAGKSVYAEKPLALTYKDGAAVLAAAEAAGMRVGSAPDTFLGAGLQSCRRLLDKGVIGEPVAATANMVCPGHESWHPNPEFYYKAGGGPLFDMGPYYLTALVSLLGPVRRVTGSTRMTRAQRTITSEPNSGQIIDVEVPTHVTGLLDFAAGPIVTLTMSFDVWSATLPWLEIYGSEGTLRLPDPNTFGGPVYVRRAGEDSWREMAVDFPYADNSRGLGVAEMAQAIEQDRPHRASGELALHVLEIMEAIGCAADTGRHVELTTTCARPAPMPATVPFPVSLRAVAQEMVVFSDDFSGYMHRKTGEIATVFQEDVNMLEWDEDLARVPAVQRERIEEAEAILYSEDYLPLPTSFEIHEYAIMERFCFSVEDDEIADDLLHQIRGKNAFRRFKDAIARYDIADDWYAYRQAALEKIARAWLQRHDIPYTEG